MSLPRIIAEALTTRGFAHATIGAMALAVHGTSRATSDFDLMVADERVLDGALWQGLREQGISVDIRRGDAVDPLAGVIRFERGAEPTVDIVVFGSRGWQAQIPGRALLVDFGFGVMPVADPSDLVLLKLYAGGPQDGWDIAALLSVADDRDALVRTVEGRIGALPQRCRRLWDRIRAEQ